MKDHFTRRRFLATAGATAGVTLLGKSLFDVSTVLAQPPWVRYNVADFVLSSQNVQSYIAGITAMQALSVSNPADPRGWTYQAAIHGSMMTGMPDWNTCQHETFGLNFFWAWHRMYLYWFERIVRSQSGDNTWSLPYWDWQANPYLPSMFQNPPTGSPPLHVANRNGAINNGSANVGNQTPGVNTAFAQPIFEGVSGADYLIQNPHNNIHVNVGGLMYSIQTAAEDPIFFLHHANVDRLWDLWLTQGGGQSDPTTDTTWENMVFGFFDENGNAQNMTPCDVLNAAQQLNYSYENEPAQVQQFCGNPPLCTANYEVVIDNCIQKPPFYLRPGGYSGYGYNYGYYEVPISYQLTQQIYGYLKNPANTLYLQHYGVTCPTQPGVVWDVYVGLPIGSTPSQKSPYYVGSYGMYGAGIADQPPDGNDAASFSFPVNTALATVLQKLKKGGNVPVSYFPTCIPGPTTNGPMQKSTLTIQQAQLTLQTVTQSGRARGKTHEEKVVAQVMSHQ